MSCEKKREKIKLIHKFSDVRRSAATGGAVPRGPKADDEKSKSLSRTYHTIKDMISSRFGPSRKEIEPEPETSLNNVAEELRKSTRSINEEDTKKKETIYGKPRVQEPLVNMQQYPKNSYGQYGHAYGYSAGQNVQSVQNVPLPGQLQPSTQIQPSLPGQSAQLHVSHHIPGGVQTVHQTQISGFTQPQAGPSQIQGGMTREFQVPGPGGLQNQPMHHAQMQAQAAPNASKHGQSVIQLQSSSQAYQSPQQMVHQNQILQSPHFAQQHAQNMHQRQLIQQMHQQQIVSQQGASPLRSGQQTSFQNPYQQQQYQVRQPAISRSQIDLPSTSRQIPESRSGNQEMYYHYQGRPRYGVPQVYIKSDNNQDAEFQRRSSARRIEKAASQPQLSFDDERGATEMQRNGSTDIRDKEKYEITVEERHGQSQGEFGRSGSQRKDEYNRPETSFGVRREELRNSTRETDYDDVKDGKETASIMPKRVEELQKCGEIDNNYSPSPLKKTNDSETPKNCQSKRVAGDVYQTTDNLKRLEDSARKSEVDHYSGQDLPAKSEPRKDDLEQGINRLKIHNQGSGSDYDKAGQSSSNVDSGRGSAVYSSGRRPPPEDQILVQGPRVYSSLTSHFFFHHQQIAK